MFEPWQRYLVTESWCSNALCNGEKSKRSKPLDRRTDAVGCVSRTVSLVMKPDVRKGSVLVLQLSVTSSKSSAGPPCTLPTTTNERWGHFRFVPL